MIISDNAICFRAKILQDYLKKAVMQWKTDLAADFMSNGRSEKMVDKTKRRLEPLEQDRGAGWSEFVDKVALGYQRPSMHGRESPLELLYAMKPRLCRTDHW